MSHGRIVCSCGALIAQCRCIGPHGPDEVRQNACERCQTRAPDHRDAEIARLTAELAREREVHLTAAHDEVEDLRQEVSEAWAALGATRSDAADATDTGALADSIRISIEFTEAENARLTADLAREREGHAATQGDRDEWRTQHENLLAMYRTAEDGRDAARAKVEELRREVSDAWAALDIARAEWQGVDGKAAALEGELAAARAQLAARDGEVAAMLRRLEAAEAVCKIACEPPTSKPQDWIDRFAAAKDVWRATRTAAGE